MKKKFYAIVTLLLCSFLSVSFVYANSIFGKLSQMEKCHVS